MRCSLFEALLDEYVEGALAARERALVAAHVAGCAGCAALLTELRVIDALLLAPRRVEPAPNFTFKVMAEVGSLPRPRRHHVPHGRMLAAYLAFAWAAIAAFVFFGGATARAAGGSLLAIATHYRDALTALAGATGSLFGPHTFGVTAGVSALLGLDLVLAGLLFAFLYYGRARATARARSTESA